MALLVAGAAGLAIAFDAFERLYDFTARYEAWELDELFPIVIVLIVALAVYAWRRAYEARGERELAQSEAKAALAEARTLAGLLPICAGCKRIRDEAGEWRGLEEYITARSQAEFSHGLCPSCLERLYGDMPDEPGPP